MEKTDILDSVDSVDFVVDIVIFNKIKLKDRLLARLGFLINSNGSSVDGYELGWQLVAPGPLTAP